LELSVEDDGAGCGPVRACRGRREAAAARRDFALAAGPSVRGSAPLTGFLLAEVGRQRRTALARGERF